MMPTHSVSDQGRVWSHHSKRLLNCKPNKWGYIQVKGAQGVRYQIHREVAMAFVPRGVDLDEVDHVNRVKVDNRASNLRWSTRTQNAYNRTTKLYGTSRFKGVCWTHGKFCAQSSVAVAYAREAVKLQGVFCPDEVRCLVEATPAILIA